MARTVPGVASALAERLEGGRYINVEINREKAARYGMTVADVQLFVTSAGGRGRWLAKRWKGLPVYPINLRYPQSWRDSPQALRQLPILTPMKQQITLADVADVKVSTGPSDAGKTENAPPDEAGFISMPAIVTWCRWFTICKKR
ncbi:cation efflux system protein [Escherichia coli]|uniref:Cation efflux system protein n=1 Tax=Escherichia coli TaxID=562 RepID=A0A376KYQ2_ECOLX|nr:cation efflux system protein [Escherichia coli]